MSYLTDEQRSWARWIGGFVHGCTDTASPWIDRSGQKCELILKAALITFFGLMFSLSAEAGQAIAGGMNVSDGNAKRGKVKSELCQGCHGVNGISVDPNTFPNLAGQFAGYIFKQVQDYQLGNRNDDTMSAMAATVTSKGDLRDIAVYFSKQKMMKGKASGNAKFKAGEKLYKKGNPKTGLYGCINCHGKNGKGKSKTNALFPIIGGQQKAYLITQLKAMKSGKRANDPAGMMQDIAKKLSSKDIENVAEYLAGQ